ncbi:hydrogen peroxide-inducible genes activator [bacterium]|nr:hydrogen peroxide-inducible genes activator [bacterium]
MPSLTQIQYALTIEKLRHFGKAAKESHVSQPTLSQQLQKLEDEVGIIIFDRGKKPILPTPEGERFLEQAKTLMRNYDKLLHISKQTKGGGVSGDFKLAIIPTVASHLLPLILKPFSQNFPHVRLFIEEMKTETIIKELENDHLDGAILATPLEENNFKVHPLYYEPFYIYFSTNHPLLKLKEVPRDKLDNLEMWVLEDGHCFKDQMLNYCSLPRSNADNMGNIRFQSGSLDTLRRLVQKNMGYTFIPALMTLGLRQDELKNHVRPFKQPHPTREISLIYRRDHWKLGIIKAIEETVAKNLPSTIGQKPDKNQKVLDVC